MPWVKLDEQFPSHPKVAQAGPLAIAMQVAALCYCNQNMTDGFVPRGIARTLLDWEIARPDGTVYTIGVTNGMSGDNVTSPWVIDLLVEAGIWEEAPGGYRIHDYLEYQPSKADVEAKKAQASEAGRRGGQAKAAKKQRPAKRTASEPPSGTLSESVAEPLAKDVADFYPDPDPVDVSISGLNHQVVRAHEDHGEGQIHLKPQVTAIAPRWLGLFPRRPQAAADVLNALAAPVDAGFIDEGIGHCVGMEPPPGTPQYLFTVLADWARQRGQVDLARAIADEGRRMKAGAVL